MKLSARLSFALTVSTLAACSAAPGADSSTSGPAAASKPAAVVSLSSPPAAAADGAPSPPRFKTQGIVSGKNPGPTPIYWGGPLLTGTIDIVPIFYGTSWPTNYESTIRTFLGSLSSTSYWGVVEGYTDTAGHRPGALKVLPAVYETDHAHGTTLADSDIINIVNEHGTPELASSSAVYLVFTDDDVNVIDENGALCTDYLGWHEQGTLTSSGGSFTGQYALIGSPAYCYTAGGGAWAYGPNGYAIDEATSAAFHEIAESATDPGADGSGYYPEIGDICAWIPGPVTTVYYSLPIGTERASADISRLRYYEYDLGQGAPYTNQQYGFAGNEGPEYLIQTIWDTTQRGCAYGTAWDDLTIIQ